MNSKKLFTFTILSLMFLVNVNVFADEVPGTPHVFYGKVYLYEGSPAPAGLTLVAKINDTEYGRTTTSDGKYDYLIVTDPYNKNNGQTIYFYVNDILANPPHKFDSLNEGLTELDLTLTASLPTPPSPPSGPTGGPTGGPSGAGTTTTVNATTTTTVVPISGKVRIDIIDITVPPNVTANESFEIEVIVKNVGDVKGSDDITLSLPRGWSANIWGARITLKPGETKKLYFTITPNENPGEITVGSSTDFKVSETIKPIIPEKPTPLAITGMFLTALGYWWIPIIVVVILLIVYFARRKPSRKKPYEFKYKRKKR